MGVMKILAITLVMLTPFTALARIGEIPDECKKRYGKVVELSKDAHTSSMTFENAGFDIKATFWKGKAHLMAYAKKRKEADAEAQPRPGLSDRDINAFLAVNTGNEVWQQIPSDDEKKTWYRSDEEVAAVCDPERNSLLILTTEFIDAETE